MNSLVIKTLQTGKRKMPEKKKATRPRITLEELTAALASDDSSVRWLTTMDYSKQKPTIEALPLLRQMLHDPDFTIVRCAAHSLRKLGPAAAEAMDDLIAAATKEYPNVPPQCFPHCVEAMAAIDPLHLGHSQLHFTEFWSPEFNNFTHQFLGLHIVNDL